MSEGSVYIPQVDNYNAVEAFVRRVYNPNGNPILDKQISIEPYAYIAEFLAIDAQTAPTFTLNIQSNADFVMTSPRFRCVQDGTDPDLSDVNPLIKILLTDSGSQQQLSNGFVDISTLFGRITNAPYDYMYPRIISGRSGLTIQAQNYSAAINYDSLQLTFAGVLVRGFN